MENPPKRIGLFIVAAVIFLGMAAVGVIFFHGPAASPSAAPAAYAPAVPSAPKALDQPPVPLTPQQAHASASTQPLASTARLLEWAQRYAATAADKRFALIAEGVALARERRPALAQLIRSDPAAALAAVVPRSVRAGLPQEILAELEDLVSARAELAVMQGCLFPPGVAHDDELYRATVINDREYRVHVFGSRLHDASLPATSLIGIALGRDMAVSEFRYRVLESGEPVGGAALGSGNFAVEANGSIHRFESFDALSAFISSLSTSEQNPVLNEADAGGGSSGVTGRPTQAWTHGVKKLLVILVDFSDLPGAPKNKIDGNATITEDYVANVINGTNGVRSFHQQNSYGKSDVLLAAAVAGDSPDVTPVLPLPNTASSYAVAYDNTLLHTHARDAAATAGYNLSSYDRIAVVFSYLGDLPGSQITYGGLANVTGSNLWLNGEFDLRVVAHELGHTHGLHHANLWQVADGNPVSLTGNSTEYGDPFDIMGSGSLSENHFSQWNKSILQWIPDSAVSVATSSNTFRIYRLDDASADLNLPRALKLVRDNTRDYWIGYRRATASSALDGGAYVVWGYNENQVGNLLDLQTPGSSLLDSPLPIGQTFNDSAAGITLQPIGQGGSGADEWLDVQVTYQPRIQWSSPSYLVNEQGGSAVLAVTRSGNSSGLVSVQYATAPGTATSPDDFASSNGTLTWADGDSSTKTITIPVVPDAVVESTETFTVTLSSSAGGVVVDNPVATVTIADPGVRDPSFAADFINNWVRRVLVQSDGSLLIAGWFTKLQDAYNTYNYGSIARMTATGAIDTAFNPGTGADNPIYALARQPDGKILVGGNFLNFNGSACGKIARLNSDGSLDVTFNSGAGANDTVYAILVQPDGKILIGGAFTTFNGTSRVYLARLLADGSLDMSFVGPTFATDFAWSVEALALQPDGKALVGGAFYFSGSPFKAGLCRVGTTGTLDATFNGITDGAHLADSTTDLRTVSEIAVQPDGKILIAGDFTAFNNVAHGGIARITSTGALDASFSPQPNGPVSALLALPDSSILIGGNFTMTNSTQTTRIARLSTNGTLDTAFAAAGGHGGFVQNFALQADGNVMLAGEFASFQSATPARPLWRFVPGLTQLPPVLQFSTDAIAGLEGTTANLTVTRTGGSAGALTVGYSTVTGTAGTADFSTTSGVLSWSGGDTSAKTIPVPITADALAESSEAFVVNLGAPVIGGALLGARQQATVTVSTAFGAWQSAYFSPSQIADPAIGGDEGDPDGDGIKNLLEFAFGLSPVSASATGLPTTSIQDINGTRYLTITFRRRTPLLDLSYAVQTSGNLSSPWSTDAVLVGSASDNGDGTETVTFRDSVGIDTAARRFLRVLVTRSP